MTTSIQNRGASAIPPETRPGFFGDKRVQETLAGFGFISPAMIVIALFVLFPMLFALVISFTNWTGLQPPGEAQGVGLANYASLVTETGIVRDEFFKALKNTIYYTLGVVPTQTILALLLAIIVNQKFLRGRGLFRTGFYFPSITSSVAIGMIFLFLFNRNGLINLLISSVGNLFGGGYKPVTWLDDPTGLVHNLFRVFGLTLSTAPEWMKTVILGQRIWDWLSGPSVTMLSIMVLVIWTTSGTMMLIFLAALQDIPIPLYEAASVDGASPWQRFRHITVPMLRPTTFFVVTIGLIGCFQVFDQIFVISQGGPAGTTLTMAWIVYRNAFRDAQAGRGAATAFVLFIIILIFTLLQRRLTGARNTV